MVKLQIITLILLITAPLPARAHDPHPRVKPTKSSRIASATKTKPAKRHPWPFVPLSIGHTMASFQQYGGSPYFHHGIDPRVDAGTSILSSTAGRIVNIENYVPGNDAYWEVAVKDEEGFVWQYHHVERRSIPHKIWDAWKSGETIEVGEKLGEIYYWSWSAFGERFHHLHLNILNAEGTFLNPFHFLNQLSDQQSPEIVKVGLLKNGREHAGSTVRGKYQVYAKVHDLIQHDKFSVPPYYIGYRINQGEEKKVWQFDSLPGKDSTEEFVEDFYVRSMSCGNYRCRELTINLGFHTSGPQYFPAESGNYEIEVIAKDYAGNTSTQSFQWTVE